jgi:hypothetical protein
MSNQDDDRFRAQPGAPKQRGDAFINKVLRQTNKAGAELGKTVGKVGHRPGSRLGRGHVAARFAGASLTQNARRVTIKARLVNLAKAGPPRTCATSSAKGLIARAGRAMPTAQQPTRRTPPLSRSAGARIGTSSASSSRRKTPNSSTTCAPTPGT